jgi:hypothetical protein
MMGSQLAVIVLLVFIAIRMEIARPPGQRDASFLVVVLLMAAYGAISTLTEGHK